MCAFAILSLTAGLGVAEDVKTPRFPHCDRLATDRSVILPAMLPPTNPSSSTNAARSVRWQALRLDRNSSVISGMSSNMVGQGQGRSREQEAKEKQEGDALRQTVMEMTPLTPPVEETNGAKNKRKDLWIITRPDAANKNPPNLSNNRGESSPNSRDANGWENLSDSRSTWGARAPDPAAVRSRNGQPLHEGILSPTPLNVPLLLPGEFRGTRDENAARVASREWVPTPLKKEVPPPPVTSAIPFASPFAVPESNTSGKPDGHPFAKPLVDFKQKPAFSGPFDTPQPTVAPPKTESLMDRWEKYFQERKQQRGF